MCSGKGPGCLRNLPTKGRNSTDLEQNFLSRLEQDPRTGRTQITSPINMIGVLLYKISFENRLCGSLLLHAALPARSRKCPAEVPSGSLLHTSRCGGASHRRARQQSSALSIERISLWPIRNSSMYRARDNSQERKFFSDDLALWPE